MKKGILAGSLFALAVTAALWLSVVIPAPGAEEREISFRTEDNRIQILGEEGWEPFEIRGVNVGTGYPGVFPNEYGISMETYYRWFTLIAEMNANTIRVYKIQSPEFYSALGRYNEEHEQKLYLLQGIDFSDHLMYSHDNILSAQSLEPIVQDTRALVDALHGDLVSVDWEKAELYCYTRDVSRYTLGYILGVEWDEIYVEFICRLNPGPRPYQGTFLCCGEEATAFESFLTRWADELMKYESEKYGAQKLISVCNWAMTDPLINQYPLQTEVSHGYVKSTESLLDIEHLQGTEKLESGLFASYNVYPYFPEFLQAGDYTSYVDDTGTVNPYRRYLMALEEHHTCPVVITEFGLPASRSSAYDDKWRNMDHGGLTEAEQGQCLKALFADIRAADCAGGIVFSWQDEWYKTIWNDRLLSDPDRRAHWSNAQSAESHYGLLAFEPGEEGKTPYPDGDLKEWGKKDRVSTGGGIRLSMQSDEKYVYFLAEGLEDTALRDGFRIALDITPRSGAASAGETSFSRDVDFLLEVDSGGKARLLVQRYYDSSLYSAIGGYPFQTVEMLYRFSENQMEENVRPDTDAFDTVTRALNNIDVTLNQQEIGRAHV